MSNSVSHLSSYLEQQLSKRFSLFRFWTLPDPTHFLKLNADSIRAVVGNATVGADSGLIESCKTSEEMACLEFQCQELDKIDLMQKCRERNKGDFRLTTQFTGKTVGIIGLGRIGLAVAKRAEAFGCPISYYSRSEKPNTNYKYYPTVVELAFKLPNSCGCMCTNQRPYNY
ncbi:hypothetical protein Leryth_016447 [Lithospermum erythrorhizon]|nr:hypothetical protein Leryth_016447 [Lithospermum erythrorhizon]